MAWTSVGSSTEQRSLKKLIEDELFSGYHVISRHRHVYSSDTTADDPGASLGRNGDWAVNLADSKYWLKANGSWVALN